LSTTPNQDRAEAMFKKEQRQRDGQQAMAEYEAERRATHEKTARLRALRLARDAAAKQVPEEKKKKRAEPRQPFAP
jgi:hypothetical protein